MHSLLALMGRWLLAPVFLVAGYNKLTNVAGTAGYMGKLGLPAPELVAWAVIAIELIGGVLLVIGWKTRWVAWALAIFTLATGIIGHAFWNYDGAQFSNQLTQFLKNLAITGGFVMLAIAGPGRLSVDKR